MHVLSPAADRDLAARDLAELARATLDEHWAVAAIPAERRSLLLERAEAAALLPGDGLGEPIADGLALLGTAYELAALGQLEAALSPTPSAGRDLAQAVLAMGAARAFRCAAALRPPLDEGESATKWALRLGALALVSRQTESYVRWWESRHHVAEVVKRTAQRLDAEPWEPYARGTLWMAWLGLMGAPVAVLPETVADDLPMLTATRSRLAAFRERRADHDVPGDGPVLNAAALRARMNEFAIRHLADATELLTVAVLRRTLPDVSAEFKLHLSAARSAMAGDHGQDVLLAWLQAAGVTLAGGVTAQLELPGF
ncbi:MAG: hypothetical protein C0516_16085 [Gemmatimonas sp.]|jgi:hypothetical protein|uniref:hypothetical protein n=1 Tax=Gemmatimonas sp. UBA7669 TaxID=1946568 RepID=UPI0025BA5F17|nr:hypothetical protein [Gemmatimonas sp. UBA7669]MBA3920084.1 hypothetical protein [Gemmatimonas sp.]